MVARSTFGRLLVALCPRAEEMQESGACRRVARPSVPEHSRAMVPGYHYPPDLAAYVRAHWPAGETLWLSHELLSEVLAVAYHASLTAEEARLTRMRLLLTPRDALPEAGAPTQGALRLRFDRPRSLTVDELRQLAPSAPFESSLVGIDAFEGKLRIWGLAHSGPAWLAPTWGGRSVVPTWTRDPIVHVTGPGLITVRCAGKLVGAIEQGHLVDAQMDVFDSQWLPAVFADVRAEIQRAHAAAQAALASPTAVETSLIGRIGQQMIRRTIQLVLGTRHGGLILMADAPRGVGSAAELAGLAFKYRFEASEPAGRYRTLLDRLLAGLAARTTNTTVDWVDFANDTSPELTELEQQIFELSRLLAGLTAIDGAVVLDKRFALLGFGAEVSNDAPAVPRVWRALDLEARRREPSAVEDVGTRHRAAYRFVQQHPRGLALVISQDGGVAFVANRDGDVVFWQQSVSR